ncbi:MAG: hypothetical protein IKF19_00030 [Bacilli bacterium]|nr:hypothetical protein [Bacilli bacterium]
MIIINDDNKYIIKLLKSKIKNVDIYNVDDISTLFKNILIKLRRKYNINGLCLIEVYVNNNYGMIIEIDNVYSYGNEIDVKIKIHIDSLFMSEIDIEQIDEICKCYLYNNKYYTDYNCLFDSDVVYKNIDKIIKDGIKIK